MTENPSISRPVDDLADFVFTNDEKTGVYVPPSPEELNAVLSDGEPFAASDGGAAGGDAGADAPLVPVNAFGTVDDIKAAFMKAMADDGFPVDNVNIGGEIKKNRFHVEGDAKGTLNGAYILHADGVPNGQYGTWKGDGKALDHKWIAKPVRELTPEEREALKRQRKENKKRREADREGEKRKQDEAAKLARQVWDAGGTDVNQSEIALAYLTGKGIGAHGGRVSTTAGHYKNRLMYARQNVYSEIRNLCFIGRPGEVKYPVTGAEVDGTYTFFPGDPDSLECDISEGIATALSILEATGHSAIVTYGKGNMIKVAQAIKDRMKADPEFLKGMRFRVCADRDEDGGGEKAAREAAQILDDCPVALPRFTAKQIAEYGAQHGTKDKDGNPKVKIPTDFNDLAGLAGLPEVKKQIEAVAGEDLDESIGFDEIEDEPMEYLWRYIIALGCVTAIAGKPGRSKSTLALLLAAYVTTGRPWPDGTPCPLGNVLLITCEDSDKKTIKPKLRAAGADLKRVRSLKIQDIQKDIGKIERCVIENEIRLIVLDPLLAYMGNVNFRDIGATRQRVDLLSGLAERHNLAFVVIAHLTKGGGTSGYDPLDRIAGSAGIGQAIRTAWIVTKDPEDPRNNRRLFLCIKNNLAADTVGFSYTVENTTVETNKGPVDVGRAEWESGTIDIDPMYALHRDEAMMTSGDGEPQNEKERATAFLLEALADGPMDTNDLQEMAKEAQIAWRTIGRAKKDLSIKCKRVIDEGGTRWQWSLNPTASTPDWVENITVKGRSLPSLPTLPSIPYKKNGRVDGTEGTMPASLPNGLYGKVGRLGRVGTVEPNTGTPIPPATTTGGKLERAKL